MSGSSRSRLDGALERARAEDRVVAFAGEVQLRRRRSASSVSFCCGEAFDEAAELDLHDLREVFVV